MNFTSAGRRLLDALGARDSRIASSWPKPDSRCDIVRNGDQFICRTHARYWATGICPGIRAAEEVHHGKP